MRKKFLLMIFVLSLFTSMGGGWLHAQTKNGVLSTNAETITLFKDDFNDGNLDGWGLIDGDNDGNDWYFLDNGNGEGNGCIISKSYLNEKVLRPKNYIYAKDSYLISESSVLTWDACPSHSNYVFDSYSVVISTNKTDWVKVFTENFNEYSPTSFITHSLKFADDDEAAEYVGKKVYFGFLCDGFHEDGNCDGVKIDNIKLTGAAPAAEPVAKIGDNNYASLQAALNDAAAGTGNVTVEILDNINLTGIDWNPVTVSAPGYPVVTVEGNNKTITGLNDMLFAGTWAGNSGLIIKNLTIAESTIKHDVEDTKGNIGVGAFVGFPQASSVITLDNCHLVNSTVEGGHWTGGLIGYAAGYAGTDGPVFMNLTVNNCSVKESTITGKGSVGGIIGHGSGNAWTMVEIQGTEVSGNTITSTGSSDNKAGAVMGTIGAAGQATTVNGVEKQGGALVAATVSGNTVKSNGTAITTIYGRQGTNTGVLELNGGSYDNYPIEEGVAYAKPAEGFVIKENANGTFGVKSFEGEGTAEKPYMINDLEELIAFRNSVNSGAKTFNAPGVYVALNADIDLTGTTWEHGIGDGINATFDGIFDGRNNTIKNFTMEVSAPAGDYVCGGLFGYIYGAATIKNLVIENATITATVNGEGQGHNVGVLVGFAYNKGGKANISNITVTGDVKVDAPNVYGVGSIVGYSYYDMGTIDNCKVLANAGSYIKGYSFVGGITGYSYSNAVISNCSVENLAITATSYSVGGIAGVVNNNNKIENCTVAETVTVNGQANVGSVVGAIGGDGSTLTIENCTAAEPMIGGNYGNNKAVVAKIGEKYYTLEGAIKAVKNGETITLIKDVAENVTLTEQTGLYYTIDGAGKTMNGAISVNSLSDTNDNRRITIKNINFKDTADANVDFISSVNTNHYPRLTIEGCTFTGSGNDGDVAVRLKSSHSVVIKDCTGTGLHSFLQNTSGWNLTIENVKVTDSKSGLALGTVQGVTVKGSDINVEGYGIRMDAQYNNSAVIESNTIEAFIPVVVRKASVESTMTFNGENTFTATNTDGLWCAIGTSEYETNGTMPTAATGRVKVTLNDTKLNAEGVYGNFVPVAKIGEEEYATLTDAIAAATEGAEVVILEAGTYNLKVKNNITIKGDVEGVEFANIGAFNMGGANVTFKNVTFTYANNSTYKGLQHSGNLVYNNCTFNGQVFLYGQSEIFSNCKFENTGDNYNVWTYSAKKVEFNECTFNSAGKSVLIYAESESIFNEVTVTDCEFNASAPVEGKAAIEMDSSLTGGIKLTIDGETTATGFAAGNVSGNNLWNNKKGNATAANNDITVKVNNETVLAPSEMGTWGGIDWTLTFDGTLTIAPTKGEPVPDKNAPTKRTYEVGEWREAVVYNSKGSASSIGGYPYDVKLVKKLVIKEGVTKIGSFTAQFPNLTGEVVIPSTVTYIGQEAFHKAPMTSLVFAVGGTEPLCIANGAFKKTLIEEVSFPGDREYIHIHHWAFGGSANLKHAYIPANVTKSWGGEHVDYFDNFNSQTNVTWAEYGSIFTGCTKMETITFENKEIRNFFFEKGRQTTNEDYIVAAAGLVAYNTVEKAIEKLEDGYDLYLVKNVTLTDTWTIPAGKTVTLNLNGKTMSQSKECTASYEMINNKGNLTITGDGKLSFTDKSAGDPNFGWGSYTVRNEGNLVVENGTIEHKGAQEFAKHMICAIFQYSGSTTINGGTISTPNYRSARLWKGNMTINGGTFDGQVWVQAVDNSAKLTINGGTFEPNGGDASSVFVTNNQYDVQLAVTDGTFKGKVGCSDAAKLAGAIKGGKFNATAVENTNKALLAEGFVFSSQVDNDGYYAVSPVENFVATVGGVGYKTFADAYNAAQAGDVINLFADIEATEVILLGKSLTINGNGHNVTSNATRVFRVTTSNTKVILNDVNMVSRTVMTYPNDIRGISIDPSLTNVELTLNECSLDFTDASACDWAYAVNVSGNGTGHNVKVIGGKYEGANVINVHGANNTIDVQGAILTSLYPNNEQYYGACIWVLQNQGSSVNATGNTFNGNNAIAFNLGTGTSLTESNNTDNTKCVVAKIGGTYYTSLKDAFAAAKAGETVVLIKDVDLAGAEWTPVNFNGVFDGQNHTISNLVVNGAGKSNQGFFAQTNNGEIKNVTFNNAKVTGRLNVGVVAGTPYTSKYTNVKVTGHVEVNGMAYVGGVGGKNAYANWTDITVDVDETSYVKANSVENGTAYRTYVGGVVGFNGEGGHTFKNISSNIKVIGSTKDIGGIFGIAHYSNKFENITFTGSVEAPADATEVGGIAGVWHNAKGYTVTFTNCTSEGTVTIGEETTTDSIVGAAYNAANETSGNSGSLIIDGKESWLKVAEVNGVKYLTLQEAINAVEDGKTITLIDNVTFTEATRTHNSGTWYDGLYYQGDKSFTIDLGGFTITHDGSVNDYLLNFKNVGSKANTIILKNGTLDAGTKAFCAICTSATQENQLTIDTENLNVINDIDNGSTIKIRGGAVLNVKAGTKITGKDSYLGIECVASTVNIYDGAEIYMNGTSSYNGCLVGACGGGTVNVYGGYGKGAKGGFIAMTSGGTINVEGGEWIANTNGTVGNNSNVYVLTAQSNIKEQGFVGPAIINVTGGIFRGGMDAWVLNNHKDEKAELNIKGGNFNANPTTYVVDKYEVVEEANGTFTVKMASFEKFYTATGVETTTGGVFSLAFEPTSETEVSVKIGSKNPAENKNYDLIIPSSVEFDGKTFAVTSIPVEGFKGCKGFDKLVVPGTITSVSASAFYNCSRLKEIIIEEGVQKLGKESFYKISDLKSLTLPSTLTKIESLCFRSTEDIETIICNAQTPPTAYDGCFTATVYKNALVYVAGTYEDYKAATGWKNFNNIIAVGATQTIVKTNYTLIATITDIWNRTCSVKIGTAPTNTKRAQLEIPEHVSFSGIKFDITSIPESGFQGCKYFEGTLTIPAYITSIGRNAFNGCSGITELVVEEGVTSLGTYGTFEGCRDIETIILPSTLETIPTRCFHNILQKLNTIVCNAMTPPTLSSNFSDNAINDGLTLYVHDVDAYKAAARWNQIKSIRLIGAVAQNMTTSREYKSLQEAINEAAGATVKVLDNVVLEEAITVAAGAEVTLDLNGKVVSYESAVVGEDMITNNGKLTVESSVAGGKITYNNTDETGSNVTISTISTVAGSELIINGGIIENTSSANYSSRVLVPYAIDILTNGNLGDVNVTINGGEIVSTNYIAIRQFVNGNVCDNSLTVKGGTITGLKRAINVQDAQGNGQVKNCAKLLVEAGDIIAGEGGYAICNFANSENVALTGGNFVGTVYSAIDGIISGGTFSEEPYSGYLADGFICEPNADGTYSVIEEPIYTQTIQLKAGWNWFSSYVETDLESLQEALGTSGVQIKDREKYTNYYPDYNTWYGELESIVANNMYMIKTIEDVTISITGNIVNAENITITLNPGWNWIASPISQAMDINVALQNLEATDGDQIKNRDIYANYYGSYDVWYGDLNTIEPGAGYMYFNNSNSVKTFRYVIARSEAKANITTDGNYWIPNASQYANNMTMTAVLDVENINYEVAAFVNGECRGSARPIYVEPLDAYMLFLTIHGEEVEEMTFKYYDIDTDTEYTLSDRINYSNNAILGSLKEPYMFTRGTTGIGEAELSQLNIYPNPTTTTAEINLNATFDKVEVFNALGVKIAEYSNVDSIDALETAGIYVIRATNNSVISHCRLVVK